MNITLQNISKAYGGRDILNDFSMDIVDGMRLCVCGPNGSGKSTLIRIMADSSPPDSGRVITPKGCRLGYVEQIIEENELDTELLTWVQSALPDWNEFWQEWDIAQKKAQEEGNQGLLNSLMEKQHDIEARYGYNPEQKAQAVLSGLGFSKNKWTMSLRKLSGGWRERAKLARVLVAGADVLLLDEPTNHLDLDAVEWLEDFLLSFQGALVFVAHDRVFMDHISTHVLYMGGSKPILRKATFSQFLEMQEEIDEQREREAKKIADAIDHKMDFIRRFKAKATKARQASSRQKQAKKLEKELEQYQPEARRRELAFKWPETPKSEKVILATADLSFQFSDGISLWPPLTFTLFRGQRVGLVGHNGCGKSTLLKILAGKLAKTSGNLQMGTLTRFGYYSQQQTETLELTGTVLGEMRRLSDNRTTEEELMSVLGLFLLGQGYFDRSISALSGGERSRLALALLFLARCNFLILDEPTNHLDLESREALTEALESFDGTLLVVAHDRHLLTTAVDEIWEVTEKGFVIFKGGFEEYDAQRQKEKTQSKNLQKSASAQNNSINNNSDPNKTLIAGGKTGLSREELKKLKREQAELRNALSRQIKPLQNKYDTMEKNMEETLQKQSDLEVLLATQEVYEDGKRASQLLKDFHEIQLKAERELEELSAIEKELTSMKRKAKELED